MARTPKPWFRTDRNAYFVTINGIRHNLGPDEAEADRLFHQLMATRRDQLPVVAAPAITTAEVCDQYLDWCEKHREARTYEWYRDHLQSFLSSLAALSTAAASELKPFHIIRWADARTGWGPNRRRGGITAILRAFNWAVKIGLIDKSPVAGTEKPTAKKRDQTVPEAHYKVMLASVRKPIQDLLTFVWETGARPQEAWHFEARHFHRDRLELPPAEAKGKKRRRLVYLTEKAAEIISRLIQQHPEGKLFRNTEGLPWNKFSMNCVFGRMKKKLGVKYALYDFRHTFCQRMLEAGVNHIAVAELMGHANAVMVATTYSHMNRAEDHLREAIRKASGGAAA